MEKKYLQRIYYLAILIAVMLGINLIATLVVNSHFSSSTDSTATQTSDTSTATSSDSSSDYDVSMMNSLTISQVVKLFSDTKKDYVVYLGRSTCSACVSFLPTLQKMQSKYSYTTQYLDITTVDTSSDDYKALVDKLAVEKTITVNGETKTANYGTFFGYTPMVFIINKGKFADGIVGAYSETKFEEFLNNNGIK
jgi:thiol-disulfide isomerase/thioredoxin